MYKTIAAAGAIAVALSFAGAAQAQQYLPDWGIKDMRDAVIASGAKVNREDNSGDPYIAAQTPEGLKFTISGRVCEGAAGAKRCKGAFLQASFTMDSESDVDAAVKKWGPEYAAISVTNDGDNGMLVSRYLIFDHGIHRENLSLNISVFYGIAEAIWDEL
jgi:hypothetical protein